MSFEIQDWLEKKIHHKEKFINYSLENVNAVFLKLQLDFRNTKIIIVGGTNGKGSGEHCGVLDEVDIISSTFGKALGGASGGFISASKNIVDTLRQKSRPYLFSNSLAPALVVACLKALEIIINNKNLITKLHENTLYFREQIAEIGYEVKGDSHPIVPIMIYDAKQAVALSEMLLEKNIYVIPFSFPVVPKNQARIRVQLSSSHTMDQLKHSISAFKECGKALNII